MILLQKIGEGITIGLIILLAIGLLILFSPILILLMIWFGIKGNIFDKEYKEYLLTINGTKFFCYNNRKNSQKYIEEQIIPILPDDINVIFLDGKTPKSEFEQKYISKALFSIKNRNGFPYLLQVEDGQIRAESINNDFYNTMNQNKNISSLMDKMNQFFTKDK